VSGGVWHPDGCRCSGCRRPPATPAQYRPPAPRANRPVYRRPRSHAYSCRCSRCVQSMPSMKNGDFGIIGPILVALVVIVPVFFWPAMAWHGYTATGGWRWDIHSTIACLTYWCILVFLVILLGLANKPKTANSHTRMPNTLDWQAPPICVHRKATRVNNTASGELAKWSCSDCQTEFDAYWHWKPPEGLGNDAGMAK
jgi:hypothetical protein